MREKALQNAPGGKMPEGYIEIPHAPPPPPLVIDDTDILDLSMELNAASIDDVPGDLDERGLERVPMADPGLDVGSNVRSMSLLLINHYSGLFPKLEAIIPQLVKDCIHVERVSFPVSTSCSTSMSRMLNLNLSIVDPSVLRDLQAHRSLDDASGPNNHNQEGP